MNASFNFICLNPRKKKRATISRMLSSGGSIRWMHLCPISFRSWPETTSEAKTALAMSKERKRSKLPNWLHLQLLKLQYNGARRYFSDRNDAVAVCWNGLNGTRRVFMQGAKHAGARRLFFELAPFPGRCTIDPSGVNYANSLPRTIEPYLSWKAGSPSDDWKQIRESVRQRQPIMAPAPNGTLPPLTDPFLFVPLQTPGDSQLRLFGGSFSTVESFIAALAEAVKHLPPEWHLRVKEHPTSPVSFADKIRSAAPNRIYIDNTDTFSQVAASRGVVTVNSSVGLEAMLFDKPVVACGQCFWAVDGVAQTAQTASELADVFRSVDTLKYDREAREAFLSYLDKCYYPKRDQSDNFTLIEQRLNGKDRLGFWGTSE